MKSLSTVRDDRSIPSARQRMFAKPLIETADKVSDEEFGAALKAGCSDANMIDIIALTTQLLLTKFISNALQTPIDFPAVPITKPKTA